MWDVSRVGSSVCAAPRRGSRCSGWMLAVLAVVASGCSLRNGSAQLVQVRSTPSDATVLLDGEPAGVTSLGMEVRRRECGSRTAPQERWICAG